MRIIKSFNTKNFIIEQKNFRPHLKNIETPLNIYKDVSNFYSNNAEYKIFIILIEKISNYYKRF